MPQCNHNPLIRFRLITQHRFQRDALEAVHHMWCGWSSGRVSMTMVVMTVLIDDLAEYQIRSDSLRRFRFKR
jgi:hypothetical protein